MTFITRARALSAVGVASLLIGASVGAGSLAQAQPRPMSYVQDRSQASTHELPATTSLHSTGQSRSYCDGSGDGVSVNDCVKHRVISPAGNAKVRGGGKYRIRVSTHPGLRNRPMIAEVQYRSVSKTGKLGSWWGHRLVRLSDGKGKGDVTTIAACAPTKPGTYQVRTAVKVPVVKKSPASKVVGKEAASLQLFPRAEVSGSASATSSASPSSSASATPSPSVSPTASTTPTPSATSASASPSTSQPASATASASASPTASALAATSSAPTANIVTSAPSTLSVASGSSSCGNSADDEEIVEYFNQISFSQLISISVTDLGTSFSLGLSCPQSQGPDFPPPGYDLVLATWDRSQSVTCNSGTIAITKAALPGLQYCQSGGSTCLFSVTLSNSQTNTIFSTTEIQVDLNPGNDTIIPQLLPATVPVCADPISECLLAGSCTPATKISTQLSLCPGSSGTCSSPSTINPYAYNQNVYFQTSIGNTQ